VGAFAFLAAIPAGAVELGEWRDDPLRLDVTNVTAVSQRFLARTNEGERVNDFGWGAGANRLNVALKWGAFTVGTRLDAAAYWLRPVDVQDSPSASLYNDTTTRFRNVIYPAKMWATWQESGVEVTGGDVYALMGRGLVLSMRKLDDLGVDTTLRGGKLALVKGKFSGTAVAGFANPSRIDDATGSSLFVSDPVTMPAANPQAQTFPARATFGSDRIAAAEFFLGRGTPVVAGFSAMGLQRCAPYAYSGRNIVEAGFFQSPVDYTLGSCDEADVNAWLGSLSKANPTYQAKKLWAFGPSLELPNMGDFGSLYLGLAFTDRERYEGAWEQPSAGNAAYLNYTVRTGEVTHSVEAKSYRNFYPVSAAVNINVNGMLAFSNVAYSLPPTTEPLIQDSAFGFFNVCSDGGRYRADWRVRDGLVLSGQGSYFLTLTEQDGGGCVASRSIGSLSRDALVPVGRDVRDFRDDVVDGFVALQYDFEENTSHAYATLGARNDRLAGHTYYQEAYINYTLSKHLRDELTLEMQGRQRIRYRDDNNVDANGDAQPWREGENYLALKVAPAWVVTQGFEYTTNNAQPTYYWNGNVQYRFDGSSNIRVFAGQQRGGLRCVSGVCRIFPAYEGVRAELTVRF
jgi:hypothetical protein